MQCYRDGQSLPSGSRKQRSTSASQNMAGFKEKIEDSDDSSFVKNTSVVSPTCAPSAAFTPAVVHVELDKKLLNCDVHLKDLRSEGLGNGCSARRLTL